MDIALFVLRLLLAVIFLAAGVAKLFDLTGTRRTLIDFGIPTTLAPPLAVALPLTEVLAAMCLMSAAWAWWGAVLALALLLFFIVVIGLSLVRGKKADCHCFGQLYSRPVNYFALVRNAVLALTAAVIVAKGVNQPDASLVTWLANLTLETHALLLLATALLGLLLLEGWVLLNLMRQNGRLLLRIESLEARVASQKARARLTVGDFAPYFELRDLHGEAHSLVTLCASGLPVLLIFWDSNCPACSLLLPEMERWRSEYASRLNVVVVSQGVRNLANTEPLRLTTVLVRKSRQVLQAYGVTEIPSAIMVNSDGRVGSPLAVGAVAIRELVVHSVSGSAADSAGDGQRISR